MMKIVSRIVSLAVIAGVLVFFSNCGSDGAATPKEKIQLEKLSKTWKIVSAKLGTTDRTVDFQNPNFTLTISGTFNSTDPEGPYNFSVSGSRPTPSPWAASGTWEFTNIGTSGDSGSLLRNDGVPMVYAINSSGQLTISDLLCTKDNCNHAGGRTDQVAGLWVFTFTP